MSNNLEYINEYNREHYRQFKAVIKPDEMEKLEKKLKELKMSKAQFLRNAIRELINK